VELADVRKLARLMEEAGLVELEVENRSGKVRLVRGAAPRGAAVVALDEEPPPPLARDRAVVPPGESLADANGDGSAPRLPDGMSAITSPMVGTFYRASAPEETPFVSVGDVVQAGQVLCIIEAMKMMNEIHAEAAARIMSISVENGTAVEYGSRLFVIELLD
jgi:acetyl-CoA carboxylase biotin carboxyl carrier protein